MSLWEVHCLPEIRKPCFIDQRPPLLLLVFASLSLPRWRWPSLASEHKTATLVRGKMSLYCERARLPMRLDTRRQGDCPPPPFFFLIWNVAHLLLSQESYSAAESISQQLNCNMLVLRGFLTQIFGSVYVISI